MMENTHYSLLNVFVHNLINYAILVNTLQSISNTILYSVSAIKQKGLNLAKNRVKLHLVAFQAEFNVD